MTPLAYQIDEAAKICGLGRTRLYDAIREGRLIAHKFGRRTVIRAENLTAFLDSLEPLRTGV
ncbi:helix-turn-helix domain-containing protein [Acetobacter musti]|uniref:Helix-turn-helix domain-containing protein n=1 Tax=Acetobacter musti TaxID=864732 RepID=A0ABX0JS67_9PROT|nr:helix-turn-helix domain-containing protein [Acetobacter musti]NHN86311.1 helix-turn-helix domain-containing protein [Acetobacter musti]